MIESILIILDHASKHTRHISGTQDLKAYMFMSIRGRPMYTYISSEINIAEHSYRWFPTMGVIDVT
jgi:hypothetical protein